MQTGPAIRLPQRPGIVYLGYMILHAYIHVELTRHEWLGVRWFFEQCCVLISKTRVGFQGSGSWQSDWHWDDDAGSKWWGRNDDSRTHAHSMNHVC